MKIKIFTCKKPRVKMKTKTISLIIAVCFLAALILPLFSHTHTWDGGTNTKNSTCIACGEKIYHCTKRGCNAFYTVAVETIPHDFLAGVCTGCGGTKELLQSAFEGVLPTFYIDTNGVEIPDRGSPEYKNYAPCNIKLQDGESLIFDETSKIRIRGTSSRWFKKKGYKLKFAHAKSIKGLASSKKYNLIASYPDPCKLRDYLALSISYTMNKNADRYAPLPVLSKVYVDDEYFGLYLLVDDIEAGKGKVELDTYSSYDEEIPFLLEMDTLAYKDGVEGVNYFALGYTDVFDYDNDGGTDLLYLIDSEKSPTPAQFAYIENYVKDCRQTLVDGDVQAFSQLVDVYSFIDFYLLGELFRNTDMAGRSVYMYKKSAEDKLVFGPSWDFDYTCSRPYRLGPNVDYTLDNAKDRFINYDWWKLFLDIPEAQALIKNRYTAYIRDIYLYGIELAKQFYSFYESDIKEDAAIWYENDVSDVNALVEDNFSWTCEYFKLRIEMMDELFLA